MDQPPLVSRGLWGSLDWRGIGALVAVGIAAFSLGVVVGLVASKVFSMSLGWALIALVRSTVIVPSAIVW